MIRLEIDAKCLPLPTLFSVDEDGARKAVVEAPSVQDLRRIAVVVRANVDFRREWNGRTIATTRPLDRDDLVLKAVKTSESDRLHVRILTPDGEVFGRHDSEPSSWRTDFVLGRGTLNGASWLEGHLRGRGIGTILYDYVEEVSGVPLTPHGHFLAPGGLNESSLAFWRKRLDREGRSLVPTGEMLRRMDLVTASDRGLDADRADLSDPDVAAILAERIGGEVATFEVPDEGTKAIVRDAGGRPWTGAWTPPEGVELDFVAADEGWRRAESADRPGTGFPFFLRSEYLRERIEARVDEFLARKASRGEWTTTTPAREIEPDLRPSF